MKEDLKHASIEHLRDLGTRDAFDEMIRRMIGHIEERGHVAEAIKEEIESEVLADIRQYIDEAEEEIEKLQKLLT